MKVEKRKISSLKGIGEKTAKLFAKRFYLSDGCVKIGQASEA